MSALAAGGAGRDRPLAGWLAGELIINAVFAQRSNLEAVELRLELRADGLLIAVHSGAPDPAVTHADHQGEPGSGLELAQRLAQRWGVRWQADGSWALWCVLGHSRTQRA